MDDKCIKLLLIEDNEDDALIIREMLAEVENASFDLECADRLSDGLEHLAEGETDVLLLDLGLPDSLGLGTLERVRTEAADTPVVVLTGLNDEMMGVKAVQAGAQDYLIKGQIYGNLLLRTLRYAMERQRLLAGLEEKNILALQASEARFRAIIEKAADGIIVVGGNGMVRFVNPAAEALFGQGAEDLLGEMFGFPVVAGETTELDIIRRGGETAVAEMQVVEIQWGGEIAYLASLRDITERKWVEEALRQAEEKYRSIFENAAEGILQTTPDGRFLSANPALARMLGYDSPQELMASTTDIEHQLYVDPKRRSEFKQLLEQGEVRDFEWQAYRMDGGVVWLSENARAVKDNGRVLHYEGAVQDVTERKRAEEQIQRQLRRLNALREIDTAITASLDVHITFNVILEQATTQLGVDAADVLLFNSHTQTLEYAARRGFRSRALRHTNLRLGEGYAGQAALERRIVNIPNLAGAENGLRRAPLLPQEEFMAYWAVPLIAKAQIKGVLEIFHRTPLDPDPEWLGFLEMLAGQAAIAIDNTTLFDNLQRSNVELTLAYDTTLEGWARALELRDYETEGHARRVVELTQRLARAMGMSEEELVHVRRGTLLHDIGKIGVPDSILLKPGPLTEEERDIMRQHPVYAYQFLSPIAYLHPALDIPYSHHEKWDGTGYPQGLQGEQIPLAARIFAVVDVWDALLSDRPYRAAWSEEKALEYIREQAGKHFAPQVVEVFLKLVVGEGQGDRRRNERRR